VLAWVNSGAHRRFEEIAILFVEPGSAKFLLFQIAEIECIFDAT
jgi:hypothetical protein